MHGANICRLGCFSTDMDGYFEVFKDMMRLDCTILESMRLSNILVITFNMYILFSLALQIAIFIKVGSETRPWGSGGVA